MVEFRIGECISMHGRTFVILGFSPMSVVPPILYLECLETGERAEADLDEVIPAIHPLNGGAGPTG